MIKAALSAEDELRLHVLSTQCEAIRINESSMTVYGIVDHLEHTVSLNPTCKDDQYLKLVKELLSNHAIAHPGGYPVFLSRWTRMGQLDSQKLSNLLKLGEPEAVVAVASSPGVTAKLAELAWWANPCSEVARFLLEHQQVVEADVGRELAQFLLEFLPFETEPSDITRSSKLVLQEGLLEEAEANSLWERGKRKTSILLGFLQQRPYALPGASNPATNRKPDSTQAWAVSNAGRLYFQTCLKILKKPADQSVVVGLLQTLAARLACLRLTEEELISIDQIEQQLSGTLDEVADTSNHSPELTRALLFLCHGGEPLVRSHFATSSAVGSLMRKQIGPILGPIEKQIETIIDQSGS